MLLLLQGCSHQVGSRAALLWLVDSHPVNTTATPLTSLCCNSVFAAINKTLIIYTPHHSPPTECHMARQEIEADCSRLLATGLFSKARPAAIPAKRGEAPQFGAVIPEQDDEEEAGADAAKVREPTGPTASCGSIEHHFCHYFQPWQYNVTEGTPGPPALTRRGLPIQR